MKGSSCAAICAALLARPALAALPTVATPPVVAAGGGGGLLQAGLGMVLVLALIFGCAWLARRVGVQRFGTSRVVSVVSSASVGPRERVVVVDVGGTWLVLGVTANQVNALHTLPARPVDGAPDAHDPAAKMLALFSTRLREALGGRANAR